jgi:hypothetical protein
VILVFACVYIDYLFELCPFLRKTNEPEIHVAKVHDEVGHDWRKLKLLLDGNLIVLQPRVERMFTQSSLPGLLQRHDCAHVNLLIGSKIVPIWPFQYQPE